ncbi:conserved protein of unknown function [Petrocella atlantisensis]|uniref:Uncharacterized protein n=1 Tax=Petrocella atlantisensis TaxID=2173034 RepID=A0A3P7PQC5_9FIRM|nr:hypothetical protein [Petrocella atlantisensis]MCF8018959.1 hypothetical protein [Vallitaleaceae bacterium]VDN46597.1 conserved protein of unknown function [Petrocella atlantisensis]
MNAVAGIGFSIVIIIYALFMITLVGLSIFIMVLGIKIAFRAIKALDIYIEKNKTVEDQSEVI